MNEARVGDSKAAYVEAYKTILRNILDQRPSGTRQRIATALGKNRSFVSHISNPAYPVPIPAAHLEVIMEICHFPPDVRRALLDAFAHAHPDKLKQVRTGRGLRSLKLEVSDFGDVTKNREFDDLVRETARRLSRLMRRSK
jgi:hypothetical protein